ncbi:MAG: RDD family protein [Paracoccaceae bacterium]|nr:MAG: RDD family protein [Paracoccaceae bacterium]
MLPFPSSLPDPERHAAFYAGTASRRVVAWVVDSLATAILTVVILPFTAFTGLFFLPLLFATVNAAWRWATLAAWSATPGMALAGIELRGSDGGRLDGGTAFLHTLGYVLSWTFVLPQILSVALMATSGRGQGLTDIVIGTAAIRRPGSV